MNAYPAHPALTKEAAHWAPTPYAWASCETCLHLRLKETAEGAIVAWCEPVGLTRPGHVCLCHCRRPGR
ncbi:MAG: hypothetical protein QMC94_05985 [Anaerosomatales bacterium]|nr:hypothetical protein [Anaerosomatales bacterium]